MTGLLSSETAKRIRRVRTDNRNMAKQGWEKVGEDGGNLWELNRGSRIGHRITDVRIAADGVSLWIKTEDMYRPTPSKEQ
jgi:hypothetical protein